VHVYTLDGAKESGFFILQRDINKIDPAPPVAPINPGAIPSHSRQAAGGDGCEHRDLRRQHHRRGRKCPTSASTARRLMPSRLSPPERPLPAVARHRDASPHERRLGQCGGPTFQKYVLDPHNAGNRVDLLIIAMGMNDLGKPNMDAFNAA